MLKDDDKMPFGQHESTIMELVPANYLDWLRDQYWLELKYPEVADYIKRNEKAIDHELENSGG